MDKMNWINLLSEDRPGKVIKQKETEFDEVNELGLTAFERDYYTIINSSYFRRLQKKTQVHTLDENDFSRNRLTHSLEVSSIAEILGKLVAKRIIKEKDDEKLPENFSGKLSMVLRCAGLLHDIGNPPFGHSGEEYIRDYFEDNEARLRENLNDQMWYDLVNFEGNAQNLRIVTKLGVSTDVEDKDHGMHLTCGVIDSLIKYPISSLDYLSDKRKIVKDGRRAGKPKRGKIGYYHSEGWILFRQADYNSTNTENIRVRNKTGTTIMVGKEWVWRKNPIMLLMEAADDIAYSTADVEDALKKRMISIDAIINSLPEKETKLYSLSHNEDDIYRILKFVREKCINDVVDAFMDNYDEIMEGTYEGELVEDAFSDDIKNLKGAIAHIFAERDKSANVRYNSHNNITNIMDMLITAKRKLREKEVEEISFKEILMLSEMKQYTIKGEREVEAMRKQKNSDGECRFNSDYLESEDIYHDYLSVVDFVSGMTDSYVGIFLANWDNPEYIYRKQNEFKERCLERLFNELPNKRLTSYQDRYVIEEIIKEISYVDCFNDLQISMILRSYISDRNISKAFDQYGIHIIKGFVDSMKEFRFISEEELQQIKARIDGLL